MGKNAIVRKLPSVETLGCTTVICSDKTGTLTTNEMSCVKLVLLGDSDSDLNIMDVEGHTYAPLGALTTADGRHEVLASSGPGQASLSMLAAIATLNNEAKIDFDHQQDMYVRAGEPTEAALKVVAEKIGVPDAALQSQLTNGRKGARAPEFTHFVSEYWERQYKRVATLEFSRDRKSMSVLCTPLSGDMGGYDSPDETMSTTSSTGSPLRRSTRQSARKANQKIHDIANAGHRHHAAPTAQNLNSNGDNVLFVKGTPEGLLKRCNRVMLADGRVEALTAKGREALMQQIESMASDALRLLALAVKFDTGDLANYDGDRHHPAQRILNNPDNFVDIETDLIFTGITGIVDPPRPQVPSSIQMCRTAGVRVIIITGDNKLTAEAFGAKIGIFDEDDDLSTKSFTGAEFFGFSKEKQVELLMNNASGSTSGMVFSRTEPKHKQMLVKMLKQEGECVAMTGDGVNDAPALKQADIGVAMGITGTEVAKQASDMVLADDNFATIVSAVEEGRAIYNNMQAFIRYLISSNIGEVAAIFFTAALGMPEGLIPVQLLWVNLVTDGPPATALGFNPADKDIMKKPPRRADDVLINGWVFFRYMVVGIYVGFACVGVFAYWYVYYEGVDGHSLITFEQLRNWHECPSWEGFKVNDFNGLDLQSDPCKYFTDGKTTASTLSLSVLVLIEMLNALNALSEDGSLVTMPPWSNPYLMLAMVVSIGMHFVILYVKPLAEVFVVEPLDFNEWMVVIAFSAPVILIDEILKFFGRMMQEQEYKRRMAELHHHPSHDHKKEE